jgi:hypothetical protein
MPYVVRDEKGNIIGLYLKKGIEEAEHIETDAPELIEFLSEAGNDAVTKELLEDYDYSVLRVLEDLIIILIRHHMINFSEFPKIAQSKLLNREALRRLLEQATHMKEQDNKKDQS